MKLIEKQDNITIKEYIKTLCLIYEKEDIEINFDIFDNGDQNNNYYLNLRFNIHNISHFNITNPEIFIEAFKEVNNILEKEEINLKYNPAKEENYGEKFKILVLNNNTDGYLKSIFPSGIGLYFNLFNINNSINTEVVLSVCQSNYPWCEAKIKIPSLNFYQIYDGLKILVKNFEIEKAKLENNKIKI